MGKAGAQTSPADGPRFSHTSKMTALSLKSVVRFFDQNAGKIGEKTGNDETGFKDRLCL